MTVAPLGFKDSMGYRVIIFVVYAALVSAGFSLLAL